MRPRRQKTLLGMFFSASLPRQVHRTQRSHSFSNHSSHLHGKKMFSVFELCCASVYIVSFSCIGLKNSDAHFLWRCHLLEISLWVRSVCMYSGNKVQLSSQSSKLSESNYVSVQESTDRLVTSSGRE